MLRAVVSKIAWIILVTWVRDNIIVEVLRKWMERIWGGEGSLEVSSVPLGPDGLVVHGATRDDEDVLALLFLHQTGWTTHRCSEKY